MKILLSAILLLSFTIAAQAETLHQPGWSETGNNTAEGNNITAGPERVAGNKVWTKEEMKERQAESSSGSSWMTSGDKPVVSKKSNGVTNIKKTLNRKIGKENADALWSSLND